jgi:putative ATP-dependent endonuclease of the OLD family
LLRGLDFYLVREGLDRSMAAKGVALVDAGGVDKLYGRVNAFVALGYETAAFRDDDVQPAPDLERVFLAHSGKLVKWRAGWALEDELFASLPDKAVAALVERAIEIHGQDLIDEHIRSASNGTMGLRQPVALLEPVGRLVLAPKQGRRAGSNQYLGWRPSPLISWVPT